MIDGHTHILFGVDDGAQTLEEAQHLLSIQAQQGVTTVVLTPHHRRGMFEVSVTQLQERYRELVAWQHAHLPEMTLLLGMEIFWDSETLADVEASNILPLGETSTHLIEFREDVTFESIFDAVQSLRFMEKSVVIAHLERYVNLRFQREDIQSLRELGAFIQVNATHVLPVSFMDRRRHVKRATHWLLKEGLVDIVASDVHNESKRPSHMAEAYCVVSRLYGEARARLLFEDNLRLLLKEASHD